MYHPYNYSRSRQRPAAAKKQITGDATIGAAIRAARRHRRMTQGDLAAAIDVSKTTIVLMEKGERGCTGIRLAALCKALDIIVSGVKSRGYWSHPSQSQIPDGDGFRVVTHEGQQLYPQPERKVTAGAGERSNRKVTAPRGSAGKVTPGARPTAGLKSKSARRRPAKPAKKKPRRKR